MEPSLVNQPRLPRRNAGGSPWPTEDKCENQFLASASGSVSVPLDLLHKIDNSTPELTIANPHERFG
jgi:hypothetical protein